MSLVLIDKVVCPSFVGDENCASVWSFSFYSAEENAASANAGDINRETGNKDLCENH